MGLAIIGDTQETDPMELLIEQPVLSLQTPDPTGSGVLVGSAGFIEAPQPGDIQIPTPVVGAVPKSVAPCCTRMVGTPTTHPPR